MKTLLRASLVAAFASGLAACLIDGEGAPPRSSSRLPPPRFAARGTARAAPPIAGGTLLALRGGEAVAAADPDHDAVWIVPLHEGAPHRVALHAGDEPGRLAQDADGQIHVVLRGAGAVATVDPAGGAVTARREVCPAPRGIAWDGAASVLRVACAGGEFVTLPPEGPARSVERLRGDLRDVVAVDGTPVVTTFRAGAVERLTLTGGRVTAAISVRAVDAARALAWRAAPAVGGGFVTLSQRVSSRTLGVPAAPPPLDGYYGDVGVSAPMAPRIEVSGPGGAIGVDFDVSDGGLAVDVAAAFDGARWRVALVSPGWAFGQGVAQAREWTFEPSALPLARPLSTRALRVAGQAVAVAYTERRELVVQSRAPGRIVTPTREIALYDDAVGDAGHDVFHASTASGLACASCHPEGGEDGMVWQFADVGARRTPSLRGGILRTAPFHWDGDLRDMGALCETVFTARMGGGALAPAQVQSLGRWLDGLTAPRAPAGDVDAIARGEALFRAEGTACASCHSGPALTNNATAAVGTGRPFQVPSLVGLAYRAPYMHDGCAATLAARFTDPACGGGDAHGRTSHLTPAQVDDLVAFLASR
ncbi:MAG: c-type cytochrome [Polyangiales bacterium]